ncbi:MAG: amino acid ABC transporter permease [Paralcaligenes sp.]
MMDSSRQFLQFYLDNGYLFLGGFAVTIILCVLGTIGSIILGFIVYLFSMLPGSFTKGVYGTYLNCIRGTPLLILLFLLYYAAPQIGILLSAYTAGVLGLVIYGSAYFAEIFRAGFQSIPRGHIEAAQAVCLSPKDTIFHIKLPEMARLVVPHIFNMSIVLVKESAVLSIITIPELTKVTISVVDTTFTVVEPYIAAAVLYWAFVEIIARVGRLSERMLSRRYGDLTST